MGLISGAYCMNLSRYAIMWQVRVALSGDMHACFCCCTELRQSGWRVHCAMLDAWRADAA